MTLTKVTPLDRLQHTITVLRGALGLVIFNDEVDPPEAYVEVHDLDLFQLLIGALRDLTGYVVKTEAVANAIHLRLWLEYED